MSKRRTKVSAEIAAATAPEPVVERPVVEEPLVQHDGGHDHHAGGHGSHEIHLPPNSWTPIALSLALTGTMVGFLVGPWLWIIGLIATIACLVAWATAARTEFQELPD